MDRRHFLALLASPAVAALADALLASNASATTVTSPDTDTDAAVHVLNGLAANLWDPLVATYPEANLVYSPASVGVAMLMAYAGASGTTRDEMTTALGVFDGPEVHHACGALLRDLDGLAEVDATNSLWVQNGFPLKAAYTDVMTADYAGALHEVDYRGDAEAARAEINAWVSTATHERIPTLVPPGMVDQLTRLVLVNAIYLKAKWVFDFQRELTQPQPFTTAAGQQVNVDTMHISRYYRYVAADGWQAVELPYQGDRLAMVVALADDPADTGFAPLSLFDRFAEQKVNLSLPTFDIGHDTNLGQQLAALGMPSAFDPGAADFSAITDAEPLYIGAVIHQANITVDEVGTEAAAATAVVMVAGAAPNPEQPVDLVLDRPFSFVVRDVVTGTVLFVGRVTNPSQRRSVR